MNQQPRLRAALTRLIYGNRDVDVELFQRRLRLNTTLENGYYRAHRLSRRNSTLRHETLILQRLALFFSDEMTFVDVGANIGLFSILASDVGNLYPNFHTVAFEVSPITFSRLQVNANRFGFEAINCPLGREEKDLEFVSGAVSGVTTVADKATAYNLESTRFTTRSRRLDSFVLKGDLFLKIDVEGQELDVLYGASAFFAEKRVKAVYVDGFDFDPAIPDFLRANGMRLVNPNNLKPFQARDFTVIALRD